MHPDPMSMPTIISDQEWLSHMQSRREILAELDEVFPDGGNLTVENGAVTALPGSGRAARDSFLAALEDMAAGFAEIEAAEQHYKGRMEVWMVQNHLSWGTRATAWLGSLVSSKLRADHRRHMELLQEKLVSPAAEERQFRLAQSMADARVQRAAMRAAAWMAQTMTAMLLTGRTPSLPLVGAVRAHDVAVVRRALLRHTVDISGAGRSRRFRIEMVPPQPPRRRPLLVWPAALGASSLPRQVDDPVAMAAAVRADGIDWSGDNECLLDVHDWQVRMPLSESGMGRLQKLLGRFRSYQSVRGREDSMVFAYDVPEGVENMRLSRVLLPRTTDQYRLSVRLRYATVLRDQSVLAIALALAGR
ncbi:hypothetical protein [Paracraurococcus lichenis]|uniref:Uncharacterized protein n=1 Tax=Paracraurococcus lichenis TaxID=3064888 RepID=A0ABT9EAA7_9PROT|nr:hypothetical protein [Paracraurococcus sp. LOR1-02]MDO9713139.1 hypothetical protein [Paracraurococcus sp. LOR1-02]